jgi:integrase
MPRKDPDEYRLRQRNGVWYVDSGSGENTKRVSTRTTDRKQAEIYRSQHIAGINNPLPPPEATVSFYLDCYKEEKSEKMRSFKNVKYMFGILKEKLGDLQPQHITSKVLTDYAKWRQTQGKRLGNGSRISKAVSNSTVLRELDILKSALKMAAGNGHIRDLPPFQMPFSPSPPRDRWISRIQAQKLMTLAKSPHLKLFIHLALATAARSGAILDLQWNQVNFNRKLIDFGKGWGNKRRSVVPINDALLEALELAYKIRTVDYVIEWDGNAVASVKNGFRRLAKDCKVNASPHTLRHTAATWMIMDGVPLAQVARLLGDSEKTVERVYGKYAPDYLREAVDSLGLCA